MIYKINSHKKLIDDVYEMVLEGDTSSITHPGQFINIKLTEQMTPYLRRPMSICDYDDHTITLIYKVVGEGTKLLSTKSVGETLDCLVGLGHGFEERDHQKVLLIGGGLGVPPMYKLCKTLISEGKDVEVILGFNSKDDVFYQEEFESLCKTYITTMDGSVGTQGTVLEVMKDLSFEAYYACGPMPMLNALAKQYPDNGYLSFEARMGCGFGACMGCSMEVKSGYKRVCVEGPVIHSREVIVNG